jgi:hypothetical protein
MGKVVVSVLEGLLLFFEQTGQLLDRPSMAGPAAQHWTPIEAPIPELRALSGGNRAV